MGYFANGTEGEAYCELYCSRCLHGDGRCTVLHVHIQHNSDECNNPDSILHILIPRRGAANDQCRMFLPKPKAAENYPCRLPEGDCCCQCELRIGDYSHPMTDGKRCTEKKGYICLGLAYEGYGHSGWWEHGPICEEFRTKREEEVNNAENS